MYGNIKLHPKDHIQPQIGNFSRRQENILKFWKYLYPFNCSAWADSCGQIGRKRSKMISFLGQTDKGPPSQTQNYAHRIYQNNSSPE